MRRIFQAVLIILCLPIGIAVGQTETTVYAKGKILNATTKEPVVALISYQSEPYANKVGDLSGSDYSIALYDNDKYSITVKATGFQTTKVLLDPATANADHIVFKDVELLAEVAKPVEPAHTVGKVIPLNNLIFDVRSANIKPSSHNQLNEVAKELHDNPRMVIQIEGHTDMDVKGNAKENFKLSEKRVEAVKGYLVSRGVSSSRVKTKAFGGTRPLYTGSDVKQKAQNRRVEARIVEL
jgi:outer membrane protein OmpA-like peptidoglycan-associated protein